MCWSLILKKGFREDCLGYLIFFASKSHIHKALNVINAMVKITWMQDLLLDRLPDLKSELAYPISLYDQMKRSSRLLDLNSSSLDSIRLNDYPVLTRSGFISIPPFGVFIHIA